MDDRELEQSLREAWQVSPPDDLLDRILTRAGGEAARRRQPALSPMGRLKLALAGALLLLFIISSLSSRRSETRIAALTNGHTEIIAGSARDQAPAIEMRRALLEELALRPHDGWRGSNAERWDWQ